MPRPSRVGRSPTTPLPEGIRNGEAGIDGPVEPGYRGGLSWESPMNRNIYSLDLEDLQKLLESLDLRSQIEEDRQRLTLFLEGEFTQLMVHLIPGGNEGEPPWYLRFLSYSVEFEPGRAGVDRQALLEWINQRNAQILFGRYYYEAESDTVAFELSMPATGGVLGEDLTRMLWIATSSVDKTHEGLKALAPAS